MLARLDEAGKGLPFPVACDPSRETIKAFGVYDSDHDIALPATILLDAEDRIAWQHIADDVFDRPREGEVLKQLKAGQG